MNKLIILGSSGCLLFLLAAIFAVSYGAMCLFAPCDRAVQFILQPLTSSLDDCELLLFPSSDKSVSHQPLRRLLIENNKAETVVGPWNEDFLVVLGCEGGRLAGPQLVHTKNRDSIALHFRKPGPE